MPHAAFLYKTIIYFKHAFSAFLGLDRLYVLPDHLEIIP